MRRRGKKTKAWENARRILKVTFEQAGITHCEAWWPHACWHYDGLSFAHSKKRADIRGDELFQVCLLCPVAHDTIERLPKQQMYEVVIEIIRRRERNLNEHTYDAD